MLTPVTIADIDAFWPTIGAREHPPPGGIAYDLIVAHCQNGPSWAWRVASHDVPDLIGGFLHTEGLPSVAWFIAARPLGRQLVPVVRALRDLIARSAVQEPRGIMTQTRVGNRAGERLAAALGFVPLGVVDDVTNWGHETWNWQQSPPSPAPDLASTQALSSRAL